MSSDDCYHSESLVDSTLLSAALGAQTKKGANTGPDNCYCVESSSGFIFPGVVLDKREKSHMVVSKKPNFTLANEFGLTLELAKRIYKRGKILEEEDLAFYSDVSLNMYLIRCMLGSRECEKIDNKVLKAINLKQLKVQANKSKRIDRNLSRVNKPKFERRSFPEDSVEYLEFKIKKNTDGNSRKNRVHPNASFKRVAREDPLIIESGSCDHDFDFSECSVLGDLQHSMSVLKKQIEDIFSSSKNLRNELRVFISSFEDQDKFTSFVPFFFDRIKPVLTVESGKYGYELTEDETDIEWIKRALADDDFENTFFYDECLELTFTDRINRFAARGLEEFNYVFSKDFAADVCGEVGKVIEYIRGMYDMVKHIVPFIDTLVDIMFETAMFAYRVFENPSFKNIVITLVHYVKNLHLPESMYGQLLSFVKDLLPRKNEVVVESFYDNASDAYGKVTKVLSANLYCALKNFILAITSFKFLPANVGKGIFTFFGSVKKVSVIEAFHSFGKMTLSILKVSDLIWAGVPISEALFADDPARCLLAKMQELNLMNTHVFSGIDTGKLEGIGMDRRKYASQLLDVMTSAKIIIPRLGKDDDCKKSLTAALATMQSNFIAVQNYINSRMRLFPFVFRVIGTPGVGKSKTITIVWKIICDYFGWEFDTLMVYVRVPSSQFFDGLQPLSQPFIKYNEVGSMNKKIAEKTGDPIVMELTSIADTAPMLLDYSDVKDKGTKYAQFLGVGMDGNDPDSNFAPSVNNRAAILRRISADIVQEVKPKFRVNNAADPALDSAKSIADPTPIMDRSFFTIVTHTAKDNFNVSTQVHLDKGDIFDFAITMKRMVKEHFDLQKEVLRPSNEVPLEVYFDRGFRGMTVTEIRDILEMKNQEQVLVESGDILGDLYEFDRVVRKAPQITSLLKKLWVFLIACYFYCVNLYIDLSVWIDDIWNGYDSPKYVSIIQFVLSSFFIVLGFTALMISQYSITYAPKLSRGLDKFILWVKRFSKILSFYLFFTRRFYFLSLIVYIVTLIMHYFVPNSVQEMINNCFVKIKSYFNAQLTYGLKQLSNTMNVKMQQFFNVCGGVKSNVSGVFPSWFGRYHTTLAVVFGTGAAYVVYKKLFPDDVVVESSFHEPSSFNEQLLNYEKAFDCGQSYKRFRRESCQVYGNRVVSTMPSLHTGALLDLSKLTGTNLRLCNVGPRGSRNYIHLLGVKSNYALINKHVFKNNKIAGTQIQITFTGGPQENLQGHDFDAPALDLVLSEGDFVQVATDLLIIRVPMDFKNIMKHFASDDVYPEKCRAAIGTKDVVASFDKGSVEFVDSNKEKVCELKGYFSYKWVEHGPGMCGTPLIIKKDIGSCIGGIHSASNSAFSAASAVNRSMLKKGCDYLSDGVMMELSSAGSLKVECGDPHPKSPFTYYDFPNLEYYGATADRVYVNDKSNICETPYANKVEDILKKYGLEKTKIFLPPMMKPTGKGLGYKNPFAICLTSIAERKKPMRKELLYKIIPELTNKILDSFGGVQLKPYDLETAINGHQDDQILRRMEASTSSGYGWNGLKGVYMPVVVDEPALRIREPIHVLKARLVRDIAEMLDEDTCRFITKGALKDEPRPVEKVEAGKTRMFFISPIDQIILARQFLGPFYTHQVEFGHKFGSSVGINIFTGADSLVEDLLSKSDKFLEWDYKSFDQKIPFEISWAAATIVENVLRESGYNEKALRIVRALLTDGLFPLLYLNGDVFTAISLQPSGKYATAEDNTIKNLVMMMYAYYTLLPEGDFFRDVSPKTYGDDVLATTSVPDIFNNKSMSEICSGVFGMEITSSAKDGTLYETLPLSEASFLKRKFVYSKTFNRYLAKLDVDSIYKSLTMYIPSRVVSEYSQFTDTLKAAQLELFFHLEEPDFNLVCADLEAMFVSSVGLKFKFTKSWADLKSDLGF